MASQYEWHSYCSSTWKYDNQCFWDAIWLYNSTSVYNYVGSFVQVTNWTLSQVLFPVLWSTKLLYLACQGLFARSEWNVNRSLWTVASLPNITIQNCASAPRSYVGFITSETLRPLWTVAKLNHTKSQRSYINLLALEPCLEQPKNFQNFQKLGWRGEGEIP